MAGMVAPLVAFGVWAFVAFIGSIVASFILQLVSGLPESNKGTRGRGLKALSGTKASRPGIKTLMIPSEEREEKANNADSSDEEDRPGMEGTKEEVIGEADTNRRGGAMTMEPMTPGNNCFVENQSDQLQQQDTYLTSNYNYLLPPRNPDDTRRLTVVLDLDETLVRSCEEDEVPVELEFAASMGTLEKLEINCEDPHGGPSERIMSFLRPGVFQFLRQLSTFAEVVVFTAGDPEYASPLVAHLDPERKTFVGSLYRNSTVKTIFHDHVKDLSCLGRDPRSTVLVDNNPFSFLFQPDNGVLCEPFFGDPSDQHLLQVVMPLLKLLACVNDVRPILRRRFNIAGWCNSLPWNQVTTQAQ